MKTGSLWFWLLAAVIILGVAYYAGFFTAVARAAGVGGGAFEEVNARAASFGEERSADFISFKNPDFGYEIKYPVGYEISYNPDYDSSLKIWAGSPVSSPEVFDLRVTDIDFGEDDFNAVTTAIDKTAFVSSQSGVIDGKRVYVVFWRQRSDLTDEMIYYKQAFFPQCAAPDGTRYTAVFTANIPENAAEDLDLADYVIYSFKC